MTGEGELIAGRYRLVFRVGRGSMGVVWRAQDELLDRTVAIKLLVLVDGADDGEAQQVARRAVREGRLAARLRHPHAITVYDVVEHDGKTAPGHGVPAPPNAWLTWPSKAMCCRRRTSPASALRWLVRRRLRTPWGSCIGT